MQNLHVYLNNNPNVRENPMSVEKKNCKICIIKQVLTKLSLPRVVQLQ